MTPNNFEIREIQQSDNKNIAKVIREVLIEFGVPKIGTAYADTTLNSLFEAYKSENAVYFVIENDKQLVGGAGIKKLDNFDGPICELQKMYFLPEVRGIGFGEKMIQQCLQKAKEFGYSHCYLETLNYMEDARKLYRKMGFIDLNAPMGDTGHYSCNLWMLKNL